MPACASRSERVAAVPSATLGSASLYRTASAPSPASRGEGEARMPASRRHARGQCPVASAASFAGSSGSALPRQATCMSGPQQQEIVAVDVARRRVGNVEHLERRTDRGERPFQRARRRPACRRAAAACSRGRSRCGPASRVPSSSQMCGSRAPGQVVGSYSMNFELGPLPRLGGDQRRADIAIAELGADHVARLALLDVGELGELGARRERPPACSRG